MAASVKMRTRFARKLPAGTACNAFGYRGVVNEDGHVVVDVPLALVDAEVEANRLVPVESQKTPPAPAKREAAATSAKK